MKRNYVIGGFIFESPTLVPDGDCYKGKNVWIGKLFKHRIWYLGISVGLFFDFKFIRNNKDYYYDGFHNEICIGCICIWWGE